MSSNAMAKKPAITAEVAADWIVNYLAKRLNVAPSSIKREVVFSEYGVDSMLAVVMSGDIANWTGEEVLPNVLYEYPTVKALAEHIASLVASKR
ncbi:MAG: acyl carrier protein [Sulfurifustaceae bacterium]